ncbi:SDR family NAD(P)-dependent oxidoreductase [Trinickia mobilis]|uniref:SDR family NAD(P)-dependent oxidoreductase n=1 Tax=Trinickia mobilis TaxID=2816356 RepID=UPI001A8D542C|nr:SDR family oxidoreductase [Trinickia mobilis]
MDTSLQGKIAVVTGGSSGIGLAIAKEFVGKGAFVFITGRRQPELDAAVAEIGRNIVAVQADSSKLADLDRLFETVKVQKGRVDIVVANAGILEKAPIGQMTEAHFDRLFTINVKGLVFTVQKALPLMPDGASVILMSSAVANKGLGNNSLYAATKAAIRNFARGWIVDLKARRVRVNVISPGPIETPGAAMAGASVFAQIAAQVPVGRLGVPDDIANTAVFLASDDASFINGADIQVDGGWAQI